MDSIEFTDGVEKTFHPPKVNWGLLISILNGWIVDH